MSYPIVTGKSGRQFETHAAAVVALIINKQEQFLMLSAPTRPNQWEPVNGAYDGGETVLEGMMREIGEEAGKQVRVRPISAVHTFNFRYDDNVPHMVSIIFLFEYLGGEVLPGDDMTGSEIKWMSLEEINSRDYEIIVPRGMNWIYERALKFYRLLKDEADIELQPPTEGLGANKNKYGD